MSGYNIKPTKQLAASLCMRSTFIRQYPQSKLTSHYFISYATNMIRGDRLTCHNASRKTSLLISKATTLCWEIWLERDSAEMIPQYSIVVVLIHLCYYLAEEQLNEVSLICLMESIHEHEFKESYQY